MLTNADAISFDEIIDRAGLLCEGLPAAQGVHAAAIKELRDRLSGGRLDVAVLGQSDRG